LFGAAGLWLADWRPQEERNASNDRGFRIRTLLWLWILVIVTFFTFSAAKQDLYIFPIVPAVAALAGLVIARRGRRCLLAAASNAQRDGSGDRLAPRRRRRRHVLHL